MDDSVLHFYDQLSGDYHRLFEDWQGFVHRQGEALDRLLQAQLGSRPQSVLDCCCGIGTQAIALALRGYQVRGTDLSTQAVERARREAQTYGVAITFGVADVRTLAEHVTDSFDVVLACDNALPHLLSDADLQQGVRSMAARLRPGGLFVASIRDYDALVQERPRSTPLKVFDNNERRIVFQVWDWSADGRSYRLQQFILQGDGTTWQTQVYTTHYRALLRAELTAMLQRAGLNDVHWHPAEETGYHQPLVTARKPPAESP
jgi:SAM-dependent methyltransferase